MVRVWHVLGLVAIGLAACLLLYAHWQTQRKRAWSANNIAVFGRAIHLYAQQNDGQWPNSLEQMLSQALRLPKDQWADLLTNPSRPDMKPAYVYLKPALPVRLIDNPGRAICLYEAYNNWGPGIHVGFLDGHGEFITNEAEFKALLARSTAPRPPTTWSWVYGATAIQGSNGVQASRPARR